MLQQLIAHGSLSLIFIALVVAGLGVPIPEDIALLTGGALANRGITSLPLTLAVCIVGVLCGDLLLFRTARRLGPAALDHPFIKRILPAEKRQWVQRKFQKHGGLIIFVARYLAGLRAGVFAVAGMHGMPTHRFVLWDTLALSLSAPLMVGLGYYFADALDRVWRNFARVEHYLLIAGVLTLIGYACRSAWRRTRRGPHGNAQR